MYKTAGKLAHMGRPVDLVGRAIPRSKTKRTVLSKNQRRKKEQVERKREQRRYRMRLERALMQRVVRSENLKDKI